MIAAPRLARAARGPDAHVKEMGLTPSHGRQAGERRVLRGRRPPTASCSCRWCCCDQWEKWDKWDAGGPSRGARFAARPAPAPRNHPSVMVWLNGATSRPPAAVGKAYLDVAAQCEWSKATAPTPPRRRARERSSGVKMRGPYDYVPTSYWLTTRRDGGRVRIRHRDRPRRRRPRSRAEAHVAHDKLGPIKTCGASTRRRRVKELSCSRRRGGALRPRHFGEDTRARRRRGPTKARGRCSKYGRNKYVSTA